MSTSKKPAAAKKAEKPAAAEPATEEPEAEAPAAKKAAPTLDGLQKDLDGMKDLMRRNGWSV